MQDVRRGLRLVRRFNDDTSHVITTVRADHMRRQRGAAFRTNRKLSGFQGVVCPSLSSTRIRVLAFWYSHRIGPVYIYLPFRN